MATIKAVPLKSFGKSQEAKVFQEWMDACAAIAGRYMAHIHLASDDPFAYNETASVSILAAGAALAGHIGLAEFGTPKKGNVSGTGRSDFWMLAEDTSWAFEFKQWAPYTAPNARLTYYMNKAVACAKQIKKKAANGSVAGLIVPLAYIKGLESQDESTLMRARSNIVQFAQSCDYAWTITGRINSPETYILLQVVRKA